MQAKSIFNRTSDGAHPFVHGILARCDASFVSGHDGISDIEDCIRVKCRVCDPDNFICKDVLKILVESAEVECSNVVVRHGQYVYTTKHAIW